MSKSEGAFVDNIKHVQAGTDISESSGGGVSPVGDKDTHQEYRSEFFSLTGNPLKVSKTFPPAFFPCQRILASAYQSLVIILLTLA